MAKSKRARLTKQLDDLCRQLVRLIYADTCQRCGKKVYGSNSQPCHVVAKGKGASWRRFDLLNIFLGCNFCHRLWHSNILDSADWFRLKWPDRYEYLERYRHGKPAIISEPEMVGLIEKYKLKVSELERETRNGTS